ncbi:alpha/beta fold hydrolase [Anaeromyxobacter sp. Red801]|uniref:alpha/beta fold hydrolase n=1 Tax=Anaeromyxobacter sp. Red801 TaxID=3411632 RepID=UPI003BA1A52E
MSSPKPTLAAGALAIALAAVPAVAAGSPLAVRYRRATVDGVGIFFREAGPPDAPAIVLLHGFPSSSHMFRDLIPLLATRFHVVAPDYPGFGHSDAPPPGAYRYTFDRVAETMEALLEQLGLERYVLYLQDYGGPIGFRLAARHPERVRGLVIQNANAYEEGLSALTREAFQAYWSDQGPEATARVRAFLRPEGTRFQYTAGARAPEALNPDAWVLDQALLDRPGNEAIQLALFLDYRENVARYAAWHAYLRAHRPRTLVVWGRGDPIFLAAGAEAYRRDLPRAEIHLLDGGHFLLEEQAPAVARLILRAMAR